MPSSLEIWTNGQHVGSWSQRRGTHSFQYSQAWVDSPDAKVLSLSLPFTPGNIPIQGDQVEFYFDNLLPDNDQIRSRIRSRFNTDSTQAFDLLSAIGRDCVGAVQLLPPDQQPLGFDTIDADPLSNEDVENYINLSLSSGRILGMHDANNELRISIAGAQEKTALLKKDGKWHIPKGATPTTHILKLPLGVIGHMQLDMQYSVENEWLCSRILNAYGVKVANCEMLQFGARKVLSVERFDRAFHKDGWIVRIPQEDFCQALGLSSNQKYESDGGPNMESIAVTLMNGTNAREDARQFLKANMLFWLLAATDGHAKNFSIFLEKDGGYRMTPLYDVLSAWPIIGHGTNQIEMQKAALAMSVRGKNRHRRIQDIKPRHWDYIAHICGLKGASEMLDEIIAQTPGVINQVRNELPDEFPIHIADSITNGMVQIVASL